MMLTCESQNIRRKT